jgi:hypothetical protein
MPHHPNPATVYQLMTHATSTTVLSSYVPRSPMSLITNEFVGHNSPNYPCLWVILGPAKGRQ